MEVNHYHLIFDLNGVLVATSEGQTRSCLMILRPGLKEFLFAYVKEFTVYIWSSTMKKSFSRHLEIITKKIGILFLSCKIVNQTLCFRNYHLLFEKLVFHKNIEDFFHLFHGTTLENTLLVDDMPHKSMFNPPFSAIFFDTFYGSHVDGNYLLKNVFPYLESLHSSRMRVYKFVELNPFGSIANVLLDDVRYAKLNACCFKCDEFFCNKVKSRFVNKKRMKYFICLLLNHYAWMV